jgi:hypothetical protein
MTQPAENIALHIAVPMAERGQGMELLLKDNHLFALTL